ncbi:MAG: hypothetical protein OXR68_07875 [Alphaproteobacteria bacterium]|nr:hypothetical protein [Alphaproteobacteria bacterium]MDD9920522.1 hypothetical protein [Alphaproteobacteria bacterium]
MKLLITTLLVVLASSAWAQPSNIRIGKSDIGPIFQNLDGMTLYTFDNDPLGQSACTGNCANRWMPLAAKGRADSGEFTAITRPNGKKQWAYRGKPLYVWVMDMEPGQITGHGVGGVWRAAQPLEQLEY